MPFHKVNLVLICTFLFIQVQSQQPTIKLLESGKRVSIRGLSVVNDNTIWASGSNGSVAISINGGKNFTWISIPGYEKRDFRDIEAFDENTAIIMAVDEPAIILKTIDGGKNWKKVFEDNTKGMFLDAMDFADAKHGMVIGDPIGDEIYGASTNDGGETWQKWKNPIKVKETGEAFFASSGTNLVHSKQGLFFVSGGKQSNLYQLGDGIMEPIPVLKGGISTGANSIAYSNTARKGMIVGGDFSKDTISRGNAVLFQYTKKHFHFTIPNAPPHGYRSCVIYLDDHTLLTCGTSGIDISKDGGLHWELIGKESFHVCQKAKKGTSVFLAGSNGKIAQLINP